MDQLANANEYDSSVTAVAAVSLTAGLVRTLAAAATAGLAGIDSTRTKRITLRALPLDELGEGQPR